MTSKITVIGKLFNLFWLIAPYIHKTIWFNFTYFPFRQACKFPVLFMSKSTVKLGGKCTLNVKNPKFGMIKIGQNFDTNRPNFGVFLDIKGEIIFNGTCQIGHNCCIKVGDKGVLSFGDNFIATYGMLLYAYHEVRIGNNGRIGWDSVVMDTSFHTLKTTDGKKTKGYGSIIIGNKVWIPSFCRVMAGAHIPDSIIFGSGSYIAKDYTSVAPYSLLAGNPLSIKKCGIFRDYSDDTITYE